MNTQNTDLYDNSQVSQFQKCPMSYYLQYVRGLKLKCEDVMRQGSEIHEQLEMHYNGFTPEDNFLMETYVEKYKDDKFKVLCTEQSIKFKIFNKLFVVVVCCVTISVNKVLILFNDSSLIIILQLKLQFK